MVDPGFQGDEERAGGTAGFSLLTLSCKSSWNVQEQFMSRRYALTFFLKSEAEVWNGVDRI